MIITFSYIPNIVQIFSHRLKLGVHIHIIHQWLVIIFGRKNIDKMVHLQLLWKSCILSVIIPNYV